MIILGRGQETYVVNMCFNLVICVTFIKRGKRFLIIPMVILDEHGILTITPEKNAEGIESAPKKQMISSLSVKEWRVSSKKFLYLLFLHE